MISKDDIKGLVSLSSFVHASLHLRSPVHVVPPLSHIYKYVSVHGIIADISRGGWSLVEIRTCDLMFLKEIQRESSFLVSIFVAISNCKGHKKHSSKVLHGPENRVQN